MTRLLDLVFEHDELAELDPSARRLALRRLLAPHVHRSDLARSVGEVADAIDAFGPLTPLMDDDAVTDVLINGPRQVWVERDGNLIRTKLRLDPAALDLLIERLLSHGARRADLSVPVADAQLSDGSRVHVVLPPIAPSGPLVSIRRFPRARLSLGDLLRRGAFDLSTANRLVKAVEDRMTIAISGGTGSGKTTLLNGLLSQVMPTERIVTIEETPELRPMCAHVVSLIARPPNLDGHGEISLSHLVRAALRMRPDRIVIGEVRGPECLDALQAMATGHAGSLMTVHARSAGDALHRLVSLALGARTGISEEAISQQVRRAFDLVVHLTRRDGTRAVVEILEVD